MRGELRKHFTATTCLKFAKECFANRKSRFKHNAVTARRRLLLTELALRCYQAENGRPPRQLAELVPKYLRHVPQDPFTSQALIYRPQTTKWLLYSVGPDGKNDGGKPLSGVLKDSPPSGDVLFDSR
jgi:hypothetical protein